MTLLIAFAVLSILVSFICSILEAALRADADVLVSEDFQNGQRFGKLVLENPFA